MIEFVFLNKEMLQTNLPLQKLYIFYPLRLTFLSFLYDFLMLLQGFFVTIKYDMFYLQIARSQNETQILASKFFNGNSSFLWPTSAMRYSSP